MDYNGLMVLWALEQSDEAFELDENRQGKYS